MYRNFVWSFLIVSFSIVTLHAAESLLPARLPKEFNTPEIRDALETWSKLKTDRDRNFFKFIRKYDRQIHGQTWYLIYSKIRFNIWDDDLPVEKLEEQIHKTFGAFNEAGSEIRVLFVPYVEIYKANVFQKSLGNQMDITDPTKLEWTKVKVLDPFDPVWLENNQVDEPHTWGRSFCKGNAIYLTSDLSSLTHELNHMLLWNADAYKEGATVNINDPEDREVLFTQTHIKALKSLLNAENCWNDFMSSLEIYVGLHRMGIEAQGWNDYIDRSYGFASENGGIRFYHRSKDKIVQASFHGKIYDMNGKMLKNIYYNIGYDRSKPVSDLETIQLEIGNYMVFSELNESIQITETLVLGRPSEFQISYRNMRKVLVFNEYSSALR